MQTKQVDIKVGLRQEVVAGIFGLLVLAAVVVLIVVLATRPPKPPDLATKALTNSGRSYSFMFYRPASVQKSDGKNYLGYKSPKFGAIANVEPYTEATFTKCPELGADWSQAFTVRINAKTEPVCQRGQTNFVMLFTSNQQINLMALVYASPQKSSIYPYLKTIFSSVKITKDEASPAQASVSS